MIAVCLTTTPARNGTLSQTLESLRVQTRPPDAIHVFGTPGCAPVVASDVHYLEVADRGPVTKLSAVAVLELAADDLVVTVDDDQSYAPQWLETLERGALAIDAAVGFAGWNVSHMLADPNGGYVYPGRTPGRSFPPVDVLEGFAGIAYRRRFLDVDVLEPPPLFRFVDDVWIASYLAARGVSRRLIGSPMLLRHYGQLPGLHNRPDFLAMNRAAARAGFGK